MAEQVLEKDDVEDVMLVDDDDEDSQANKYLLFNIADEVYGMNIKHVTEIIELQKITQVPDMPNYIKGVINLRGKVIPVMDVRLRFDMEERQHDDRTCIIIVNVNDSSIGMLVDTVAEVQDISPDRVEVPPNFKSERGHEQYISGLGKVGDGVKILLDAEKLLSQEDMQAVTEVSIKKENDAK